MTVVDLKTCEYFFLPLNPLCNTTTTTTTIASTTTTTSSTSTSTTTSSTSSSTTTSTSSTTTTSSSTTTTTSSSTTSTTSTTTSSSTTSTSTTSTTTTLPPTTTTTTTRPWEYGPNLILNADGDNTTDWVDSNEDGLGDDWYGDPYYSWAYNIVYGVNGFSTNRQKAQPISGGNGAILATYGYLNMINIPVGTVYHFWMKYRSYYPISLYLLEWNQAYGGRLITTFPANTGDAIEVEGDIIMEVGMSRLFGIALHPHFTWLEIDQVMLKEKIYL